VSAPRLAAWLVAVGLAVGVRVWGALAEGLGWGYDASGHLAYVLFLDAYRALPWADQGWSYYHPPLHYALGWGLAQLGSGEALMRGLALLGGAASLGTAALAAWLVRQVSPARPWLALVGFAGVAFLPVQLAVGAMPGNQTTECLLVAAALCACLANERRARPTLAADAGVGVLLGLALLTKFSAALAWVVVLAVVGAGARLWPGRGGARRRAVRAALLAGIALLLAAPVYLRNARAFATPVPRNSDFPLLLGVEAAQPPGSRSWRDYASFPAAAFSDPNPLAPHLLHSVWASLYLNVWYDTHRDSDVERALDLERQVRAAARIMPLLGLLPTALALAGALLAARDVWRGRRREVYVPLLLLCGVSLAALLRFSWTMPTWAALKASYALPLSVAFAVFLARALEELLERGRRGLAAALGAALAAVGLAAAAVAIPGWILPRRLDSPAAGPVHFYFGEYAEARRLYGRLAETSARPGAWLESLAAVESAAGRSAPARRLQARAVRLAAEHGPADAAREARLALMIALDGDVPAARARLDALLEAGAVGAESRPELLANRGALRAALGDAVGAESDLRGALAVAPEMLPAWLNLSLVLPRLGRAEQARAALERAAREACRGPRGYPYAVGTGEAIEWGVARRPLLLLDGGDLRLALPAFFRETCRHLHAAGDAP
jgi:tetratricopeptide (TPR) repeat protein